MKLPKIWIFLAQLLLHCYAIPEDKGYTQSTSTLWWTPTTSYASVSVGTSTSTVVLAVTQQPNVVVTLTSYIPCPVTSTVWVFECQSCGAVTVTQVTQVTQQVTQGAQVGVTTQTLYTTTTQPAQQSTRTYTSNGYVVVVVNPTATGTGQAAIVNGDSSKCETNLIWIATITLTTLLLVL